MLLRTYLSTHRTEHQLRRVIDFLGVQVKYIAKDVREANRASLDSINVYQEKQLAIDKAADERIVRGLSEETSFSLLELATEERGEIEQLHINSRKKTEHEPRYSLTADPLDGSSLIKANLAVGTIFAIHDGKLTDLKPARETLISAMYVLYGPSTTMVLATETGVNEFILDQANNWVLKQENLRLEEKGSMFGFGGAWIDWVQQHRNYRAKLEELGYKQRNSGGFVPDINQIVMDCGGVFAYPPTTKSPNGKLRLWFECQPMAYIAERLGGLAIDGRRNILDIPPKDLKQRTPIYLGSKEPVELIKPFYQEVA